MRHHGTDGREADFSDGSAAVKTHREQVNRGCLAPGGPLILRHLWLGSRVARGTSGCEAAEPVAWLEKRRCAKMRGRKASCSLTTLGMLTESSGNGETAETRVSWEGWRDGWLSCSHTVPVPVLERDIVAKLRRYADVEVPTVLMDVLPW
ncbi:hypothetical protein EYF80_043507 [Liparis tanakae]|uniref:Uncharacterized protein n=1 Tax=Liparis tanakae TaxID=230148 RepID=A0A4Z2FYF4_9TELE|nr:hypothetical protein EYF80_043507 [Liparis tanakae]